MTFVSSLKKLADIDRMKKRFLQTDEGRRRRVSLSLFGTFDWQSYLVSICCIRVDGQVACHLSVMLEHRLPSLSFFLEKQTSINRLTFALSSSIGTTFAFGLFSSFIIDFSFLVFASLSTWTSSRLMPGETIPDDPQHERLVYTYTYTSDGDNGQPPQSNTVKVTTTVEEETTPDGTKVVRKKEESQQVSKVTKIQKITRVHRHLVDPLTGELIRQDDPRYQALIAEYGEPTPTTWSDEHIVYEGGSMPSNAIVTKHETSAGFSPNSSFTQQKWDTKNFDGDSLCVFANWFRSRFRTAEEHSPSSARSSTTTNTTTTTATNRQHQSHRMDRSTYASGGDGSDTGLSTTIVTNGGRSDQHRNIYSNGRSSGRIPPQQHVNGNGRYTYGQDSVETRYNGARYNEPENNKSVFRLPLIRLRFNCVDPFSEYRREDHRLRSQWSELSRWTVPGRRESLRRSRTGSTR